MLGRLNLGERALLYVALGLGAILAITPLWYMVTVALQPKIFILEAPSSLLPRAVTLDNFLKAWSENDFQRYFFNSLVVAVATTALSTALSAMAAYGFARYRFRGKELVFGIVLVSLMVPGIMLIIPQFIVAKSLGLLNSLHGLVAVYVAMSFALNTFLLRGFFEELPRELEEATFVDGGTPLTAFRHVVLPLAQPALATVAVFTFLFSWDEFTWALTSLNREELRTLPIAIATFQSAHQTEWSLVFAASLIAVAPVIAAFVLGQRFFIRGLATSGLKG
jgi:multiple sugar transport system permease protein